MEKHTAKRPPGAASSMFHYREYSNETYHIQKKNAKKVSQVTYLLLILLCSLGKPLSLHAQYYSPRNDVWAFGFGQGINFLPGIVPHAMGTGMSTSEGSASICDNNGTLLFYTNGKNVYTSAGTIMPNGSSIVPYATSSCSQAAAIVPDPGNPNRYYVFSLEQGDNSSWGTPPTACHLDYCIVDMTLNLLQGDVIAATRATKVDSQLCEKMTVIAGDNCDFWVLVHEKDAPNFRAYNVTAAGVSPAVVSTATGETPIGANAYKIGTIKASPNGRLIANCVTNGAYGGIPDDRLEVLDFNSGTGIVTGCNVLNNLTYQYDAEFSPDNTKLYVQIIKTGGAPPSQLLQYDLTNYPFVPPATTIHSSATDWGGEMKLGPDGKIYIQMGSSKIDGINSPNNAGVSCGYVSPIIVVAGSGLGMPNATVAGKTIMGNTRICLGTTSLLTTGLGTGTWSSSNSAVATVSAGGLVTGVALGTAMIIYTLPAGCSTSILVTVMPLPSPITGNAVLCPGFTMHLFDATADGTWSSSNTGVANVGSSSGLVSGVANGTCIITYTAPNGCYATTIVTVSSSVPISGSTPLCVGQSITLTSARSGGTWSSSNTSIATVGTSGIVTGISDGTAIITYTLGGGCTGTTVVSVNPLPAAISGRLTVCPGQTTSLSDSTGGGTWSSSNTGVATVGLSSGVVTGISLGTSTITYTATTGCYRTAVVTVVPLPDTIAGPDSICISMTDTLTNTTSGTWSSSNTGVATIGSASGIVTPVSVGTTIITFTSSITGCYTTKILTIVSGPSAISGSLSICLGLTTTLTDAGGGTWSSSNTAVATVGSSSGIVDGLALGTSTITYTLPTHCYTTATVTVNPWPNAIAGTFTVCVGATTHLSDSGSGTWSSSNTGIATVGVSSGIVTGVSAGTVMISYRLSTGCYATATVTVAPQPAAITGTLHVCVGSTTDLDDTSSGTWSSSNTGIATIGLTDGIVNGISAGVITITFTSSTNGCYRIASLTVNPLPAAISGTLNVCVGQTTTLTDAGGGTWTSSNTGVATVGLSSGLVTGISPGTSTITYTLSTGCYATTTVTVNPQPAAIFGSLNVCVGNTTLLSDSGGGTWSSSNTAVATVDSLSGLVTGVSPGTSRITYTLSTGCRTFAVITVNPLPATILGTLHVCVGLTTTLSDGGGGTWTSSNTAVATIGSSSGIATGVTEGTSVITYTLPTGCYTTAVLTVNPQPDSITGNVPVCVGSSILLHDSTTGGTWSGTTSVILVGTSGTVSGMSVGTGRVTYMLPTGCYVTTVVTVTPAPPAITGGGSICVGDVLHLHDSATGGHWESGNTGVATVGLSDGIVTGISAGTAVIYYVLSTGCSVYTIVTINAQPGPINGILTVCEGATTSLSDSLSGGTWSSSNVAVGTINTSGIVTGRSAGTTMISYITTGGCYATAVVTVKPLPAPIGGRLDVCVGSVTTLTDIITDGTWSSANTNVSVDSLTGDVTGISAGIALITYTNPCGSVYATVTVNPLPGPIMGVSPVCEMASVTLHDSVSGGTWSSADATVSVDPVTGLVTGVSAGTALITYTTICGTVYATITINPLPAAIGGSLTVCTGAVTRLTDTITDGTWSSADSTVTVDASTGDVTGVIPGTATITYTNPCGSVYAVVTVLPLPAPIGGTLTTCVGLSTTLTDSVGGGTWSSTDTTVSVNTTTGEITGLHEGTATITYTTVCGSVYAVVTVYPVPSPILGVSAVCAGQTISLSDTTSGGTWSITPVVIATVDSSTGIVTGVSGGIATVTYTLSTGCYVTADVTVNPVPEILGRLYVCVGMTTTLNVSSWAGGGTWSSTDTTVSVGASTGVVTGLYAGTATVTYTLPTGCYATAVVTVYPVPTNILASTFELCAGTTITLTGIPTGGIWSSADTTIATVDSATGIVTGISAGTVDITYGFGIVGAYGCSIATLVTVDPSPRPFVVNKSIPDNACVGNVFEVYVDSGYAGTCTTAWTTSSGIISITGVTSPYTFTCLGAGTVTVTYTATSTTGLMCSGSLIDTITIHAPVLSIITSPTAIPGTPPIVMECDGATLTGRVIDLATGLTDSCTYNWAPSTGLSSVTDSSVIAAPPAFTTYTLVVTDAYGCADTDSVAVEPVHNPCVCALINSAASAGPVIPIAPFGLSGTITASSSVPAGNYYMANIVHISPSSGPVVHLTNCVIFIDAGLSLIVDPGATLILDHCHLFCCNPQMWQGIILQSDLAHSLQGQIQLINNTMIEDAQVAVDVPSPITPAGYSTGMTIPDKLVIYSSGATLNKNKTGIRISDYHANMPMLLTPYLGWPYPTDPTAGYPFKIENTVFTSRNFYSYSNTAGATIFNYPDIWPFNWACTFGDYDPSTLMFSTSPNYGAKDSWAPPTPYSPPFNIDNPLPCPNGVYSFSPCNDSLSAEKGIDLENVGFTIGGAPGTEVYSGMVIGTVPITTNNDEQNMFDNMYYGIYAINSNVVVRNSSFMHENGFLNPPLGGNGIYARNTNPAGMSFPNLYKLYVYGSDGSAIAKRGGAIATGNSFYDCITDVETHDYYNIKAEFARMMSNHSMAAASLTGGHGAYGFMMQSSNYYNVQVNYNNIYNITTGISYDATTATAGTSQYFGELSIQRNHLQATNIVGAPPTLGEFMTQGIIVTDQFPGVYPMYSGSQVNANSNTIDQAFNGIHIEGFNYQIQTVTASSNTITLLQDGAALTAPQTGIYMNSINPGFIQDNQVSGPGAMIPVPPSVTMAPYGYPIMEGIHVTKVSGHVPGGPSPSEICSNRIHDINTGIIVEGGNGIRFLNNNMTNNAYGFVLDGSTGMGVGVSFRNGNRWPGAWPAPRWQTYTMGVSDPNLDPLYQSASFLPTINGTEPPATGPYMAPSSLITSTGVYICAPVPSSTITFRTDDTTVTNDLLPSNGTADIAVIPNPNNGTFILKGIFTDVADEDQVDIDVVNLLGQSMLTDMVTMKKGILNTTISLGNTAANGIYLVKVKTQNTSKTLRITVDK